MESSDPFRHNLTMSSDYDPCSGSAIRKELKSMPVDIQHVSDCFREVAEDLRTKIKIPGENGEQAGKRRNDWDLYSEAWILLVFKTLH